MTVRLARWSATHPWRAVGLWLAFVVVAVAVGSLSGLHTAGDTDYMSGQSQRAARWIDAAGLDDPDTENVLITPRTGSLDAARAASALADARRAMSALPEVAAV
ncbi:MAG TPA: hypothetical protein VHC23_04165, partial [Jatrophihabitans sp.]|nr:hypothetical protein [Jatrophihabitans sp.]